MEEGTNEPISVQNIMIMKCFKLQQIVAVDALPERTNTSRRKDEEEVNSARSEALMLFLLKDMSTKLAEYFVLAHNHFEVPTYVCFSENLK